MVRRPSQIPVMWACLAALLLGVRVPKAVSPPKLSTASHSCHGQLGGALTSPLAVTWHLSEAPGTGLLVVLLSGSCFVRGR